MVDKAAAVQNASLVVKWNEAAVTLFSAAALPPPVIARAVFVTHNCLYDTWAAYDETAIGLYWPRDLRQRRVRRRPSRTSCLVCQWRKAQALQGCPAGMQAALAPTFWCGASPQGNLCTQQKRPRVHRGASRSRRQQ